MPSSTLLAGPNNHYDAAMQYESDPAYTLAASRCFGVVPQVDMSEFMDDSLEGVHLYASALRNVLGHYTAEVIRENKYARAEFFLSVVWISCHEPSGQLLLGLQMPWLQRLLKLVKQARKSGKDVSYLVDTRISEDEEEYETDEGGPIMGQEGSMSHEEENEHRQKRAKYSRPQHQDEEYEEDNLMEVKERVKHDNRDGSEAFEEEPEDKDWEDDEEPIAASTRNKPRNKETSSARQIPTKGHHALNSCVRCRRGRKKCTKGLPLCARCAGLGKPCVYGGTVAEARRGVRAYRRKK